MKPTNCKKIYWIPKQVMKLRDPLDFLQLVGLITLFRDQVTFLTVSGFRYLFRDPLAEKLVDPERGNETH
jgi:hypothetical protein